MSTGTPDSLEAVIRQAGEDWLIDWYKPKEQAIAHLHNIIRDANEWAAHHLNDNCPNLTPEAVVAAYAANPHKIRALLQVIGSLGSPQFLIMAWRILHGANIQAIRLTYEDSQPFDLYIRLAAPDGMIEEYRSSDIDDAVVLRHLGTMKMGDQGIFDGFYALNLSPGHR